MPSLPGALALQVGALLQGDVDAAPADAELLVRARAQDRAALQALYVRFAPGVARFLGDLLGDRASAADATQETFIRAFRRLDSLRDDARLAPWLFGIARNVVLEQRKERRRQADPELAVDVRTDRNTPESELLGRETADVVQRALGQLSEDRRAALLLRLDHHLAYDEIARLMGWTLAKVKVEIHRGREALRAELSRHGEEGP
jgi:RNA polymerase sigma-70 factor (ECF subfamily)